MSLPSSTFAEVVGRYAAQASNPWVKAAEARLRTPLAVAVVGRAGVGRDAVAAALAGSGVRVVTDGADVRVVVIAEALKPEDVRALRGDVPAVLVLNKADLAGRVVGGPLAAAERIADGIAAAVGLRVVPMIAHLAAVELDDPLVEALRTLATAPADMTSADAFVDSDHVLPALVRRRLLERLDRFGLAHAVLAVIEGAPSASVVARLRALSQTDVVIERLADTAADVGYRRVCAAMSDLRRVATESHDDELGAFLATDEVVIAVMASAVDVIEALGLRVDPGDEPQTHLRRAVRWRHYADGPLDALHRRCAADISRGSLRLMGRAR